MNRVMDNIELVSHVSLVHRWTLPVMEHELECSFFTFDPSPPIYLLNGYMVRLLNCNLCQLTDGRRVYSGDADNGRHDTGQRWRFLECPRNWTDALWPKRNDITYPLMSLVIVIIHVLQFTQQLAPDQQFCFGTLSNLIALENFIQLYLFLYFL